MIRFIAGLALLLFPFLVAAQTLNPVVDEGWITTSADTLTISASTNFIGSLLITNDSTTTAYLLWKTDKDSGWRTLYPAISSGNGESYFINRKYFKTIYRKASVDSVYSRVWVD